jgi:drug/metabolite transporter (DMT)-like permease
VSSLAIGLVLALGASVALNASFVLQHAGSADAPQIDARRPISTLRGLLRSRLWLAGGALGLAGWAAHVGALSHAPLSLVQAFVAGGVILAMPIASRLVGHRPGRAERNAVVLLGASLALLSIGASVSRHATVHPVPLTACLAVATVLAGLVASRNGAPMLGLAGGILYGAADIAIKALTEVGSHGGASAVLTSPWLAAAALATVAAFFSFQRALQLGNAVPVIALMTAGTSVTSITAGLLVLGDPLGRTPALAAIHALAFVTTVVAAWRLAPTQAALAVGEPALGQTVPQPQEA